MSTKSFQANILFHSGSLVFNNVQHCSSLIGIAAIGILLYVINGGDTFHWVWQTSACRRYNKSRTGCEKIWRNCGAQYPSSWGKERLIPKLINQLIHSAWIIWTGNYGLSTHPIARRVAWKIRHSGVGQWTSCDTFSYNLSIRLHCGGDTVTISWVTDSLVWWMECPSSEQGVPGKIPGRFNPKTLKLVSTACMLGTQYPGRARRHKWT